MNALSFNLFKGATENKYWEFEMLRDNEGHLLVSPTNRPAKHITSALSAAVRRCAEANGMEHVISVELTQHKEFARYASEEVATFLEQLIKRKDDEELIVQSPSQDVLNVYTTPEHKEIFETYKPLLQKYYPGEHELEFNVFVGQPTQDDAVESEASEHKPTAPVGISRPRYKMRETRQSVSVRDITDTPDMMFELPNPPLVLNYTRHDIAINGCDVLNTSDARLVGVEHINNQPIIGAVVDFTSPVAGLKAIDSIFNHNPDLCIYVIWHNGSQWVMEQYVRV